MAAHSTCDMGAAPHKIAIVLPQTYGTFAKGLLSANKRTPLARRKDYFGKAKGLLFAWALDKRIYNSYPRLKFWNAVLSQWLSIRNSHPCFFLYLWMK